MHSGLSWWMHCCIKDNGNVDRVQACQFLQKLKGLSNFNTCRSALANGQKECNAGFSQKILVKPVLQLSFPSTKADDNE
jgi:hypothetical protein